MARALTERTTEQQLQSRATSSAAQYESACTRCGGLMVNDFCMDLLNSSGESKFAAKRCVLCGEVVDPVILQNRGTRQEPMVGQPTWRIEPSHRVTIKGRLLITKEALMLTTPKVIGLMSCGFLLCLGLSSVAQAGNMDSSAELNTAGQSDTREGGQAGYKAMHDHLNNAAQSPMREGGQAGYKEMRNQPNNAAQSSMREGGQAGYKEMRDQSDNAAQSPMRQGGQASEKIDGQS